MRSGLSGARVEWICFDAYLDVGVLSAVVLIGICTIVAGVIWKLEKKDSAIWTALGLLILGITVTICFWRPFAWINEPGAPFLQLTVIVWLLYAEIAYLAATGFRVLRQSDRR